MVEILLDKKREFKLAFKAYRRAEKELGFTFKELRENPELGENFETTLVIIWAGLLHSDPNLTLEDVEDILDGIPLEEIEERLQSVMSQINPQDNKVGKGKSAANGIGKKSRK